MAAGLVDGGWTTTMAAVDGDYRRRGRWLEDNSTAASSRGTGEIDGGGGVVRWLDWAATNGRPSAADDGRERGGVKRGFHGQGKAGSQGVGFLG